MQFVPFPLMKPRQPSSFHIFMRPFPTDSLYSLRPALWTWKRILSRSRGDTTVLETAPATPPAQKAATTGCETISRSWRTLGPYCFGLRMSVRGRAHKLESVILRDDVKEAYRRHLQVYSHTLCLGVLSYGATRPWRIRSEKHPLTDQLPQFKVSVTFVCIRSCC